MIDTVALAFPKPDLEGWVGWDLHKTRSGHPTYRKNPIAELAATTYYPQVLGYRSKNPLGGWRPTVKIVASIPKLLYGNNLVEVAEDQYGEVVRVLRSRLRDLGIRVSEAEISRATVSQVHYSKNFLLRGYTAFYVVSELRKLSVSLRMSLTTKEYPNGGVGLSMYTKQYSIEFYDKLAELGVENESLLAHRDPATDVLRIEARLLTKRKINSVFRELEYPTDPRFREVFSLEKSRGVVERYWNECVLQERDLLSAAPITPKELLRSILRSPDIRGNKALLRTALVLLSRDGQGRRELRDMLRGRITNHTWYDYDNQIDETAHILAENPGGWIGQVSDQLARYEQFRIEAINLAGPTMTI